MPIDGGTDAVPLPNTFTGARSGILMFGITPPRRTSTPDQIRTIAAATIERLAPLGLDGLALYDIDDESDRNPAQRPFPYLPTIDPAAFHRDYLGAWDSPVVIYRCVGKYSEEELRRWLEAADPGNVMSVFVGASSRHKPARTTLAQAQALRDEVRPDLVLGGVAIAEREDEHLRILAKQDRGCEFFISQVTFNVDAAKTLVSDYFYASRDLDTPPRLFLFTFSICGSVKTLAFLEWLGVDVPRWLRNALRNSLDPVAESLEQCVANARELQAFCRRLGVPFGFNVESVSIRKVEIEASVALARELRGLLDED